MIKALHKNMLHIFTLCSVSESVNTSIHWLSVAHKNIKVNDKIVKTSKSNRHSERTASPCLCSHKRKFLYFLKASLFSPQLFVKYRFTLGIFKFSGTS